ncbi:hypothetical protein [Actinomadura fibrosa]
MTGFGLVLGMLADSWGRVAMQVGADTRSLLRRVAARIAAERPGGADWDARNELVEVLSAVLPDDDPLLPVLRAARRGTAVDDVALVSRRLLEEMDGLEVAGDVIGPQEVEFWAERRLLKAPALSEDDLVALGLDPDDPDLILLRRPDGGGQWPEFQFSTDGSPIPLVRYINAFLEAADDPWGAADWWLCPNAWLEGRIPSQALGRLDDAVLVSAARAVDPGV